MGDSGADLTHRAYELAIGAGLGTWEHSTDVFSHHDDTRPRSGLSRLVGARKGRPGQLVLHVFEDGVVIERHRGSLRGALSESVTADLVELEGTPASGSRVGLRLTLASGEALVLLEPVTGSCETLTLVASRCRSTSPDPLPYRDAVAALPAESWI
ncbi:hypothetical protein [Nocardioides jensenii]|uniref:hypothetical protein n=1 Tax=Nocardioides jensenii TaxID=1843 RepID=UPI000830F3EB|nr:hypothetical protein [Nocardioides jensenii]